FFFFFSSRRRHTRWPRDWSSDVCSSDLTMLNEGHRRESRGTDVVIGYVETHGRPQTQAQVGDLEIIPRKKVTYRGVTLEEMDTEIGRASCREGVWMREGGGA